MKLERIVLALILGLTLITPAFSQDPVMDLKSEELGPHQRPVVTFNHEQHSSILECARCHHDYDRYGNNQGSDGQPCSDCHSRVAGKNPVPLEEAFHTLCKQCHVQMVDKKIAAAPVMCGQCHARK